LARNVTESEIDALLARGSSARVPVVSRDFREPRRFSEAELEALTRPAEQVAIAVVEALRAVILAEIVHGPPEVAETALDSALDPSRGDFVACVAEGPAGASLAIVDAAAAVVLAELALGLDEGEQPPSRALTHLERELVERALSRVLERAAAAFSAPVKEPRLAASRAALLRELAHDTDRRRVAVRVPITIGPLRTVVHVVLSGVKPPAAPRSAAQAAAPKDAKRAGIPAEIQPTKVELCAVLARTDVLLTEILALEPGDVITLDASPGEAIRLEVEGQPRALVRFGAHDGRLAVRVQEILKCHTQR
jgi:flagellar motor switch protein FliM